MTKEILTKLQELQREFLRNLMSIETEAIEAGDMQTYRICAAIRMQLTKE